ncbi:MAG: hypothetical protein E7503_02505 [Ruminococcus sp.]|nr:hypothetical protein [Ruminococcus sp.]
MTFWFPGLGPAHNRQYKPDGTPRTPDPSMNFVGIFSFVISVLVLMSAITANWDFLLAVLVLLFVGTIPYGILFPKIREKMQRMKTQAPAKYRVLDAVDVWCFRLAWIVMIVALIFFILH